jgi:hypothetical protein
VTSLAGDNAREWDCRSLLADWDNGTGGSAIPGKSSRGSEPSSFSVRSPRRCWGREHTIAMGEDINTG